LKDLKSRLLDNSVNNQSATNITSPVDYKNESVITEFEFSGSSFLGCG
jgi:hypothetical protein